MLFLITMIVSAHCRIDVTSKCGFRHIIFRSFVGGAAIQQIRQVSRQKTHMPRPLTCLAISRESCSK